MGDITRSCKNCKTEKKLNEFEALPSGGVRGACRSCYNKRRRDLQGGAKREREKRESKILDIVESLPGCEIVDRYKLEDGAYRLKINYKGFEWEARQSSFLKMVFPWSQAKQDHLNGLSCIYRFDDVQGRVLYVGKSKRLPYRLSQHFSPSTISMYNQEWKFEVAKVYYMEMETRSDMHIAEMYLIDKLSPKYNTDSSDCDGTTFHLDLPPFKEVWVNFVYDR